MTEASVLAISGFTMITAFMVLIMVKRVTAIVGLVLIPLVFAVLLGQGLGAGDMMLKGVQQVAPTAALMVFAIFYFAIMIDAGLFLPLVRVIVRWAGSNPVRVTVGHAALVSIVALDGDGTTTLLVSVAAMLPIYRRLGISVLKFAVIGGLCGTILNLMPWGGPAARVAAALKINPDELFYPLIPAMCAALAATFLLAWVFGLQERKRLAGQTVAATETAPDNQTLTTAFESDVDALRPRLIWVNFALTVAVMVSVVLRLAPMHACFMVGAALALLINYPKAADQRARLLTHGGNVLSVAVMILSAGAFTGVLEGTGMVDAMAGSIVHVVPREVGPHFALVTAILASPLTFFMSNDAFYFGVLPVLAEAGTAYGLTPEQMGRASLLGQPIHGLSPLVAAVYLKCALLDIELADLQRFALKYYIPVTAVLVAAAVLTGAVPSGF